MQEPNSVAGANATPARPRLTLVGQVDPACTDAPGRLDACPDDLDDLSSDDAVEQDCRNGTPMRLVRTLLYTTTLVETRGAETRHAYHAVVAPTPEHAAKCLLARLHGSVAGIVSMIVGFDRSLPIAQALVSDAVADMLEMIDEDPNSPIAQGLDLFLEQRFTL